MQKLIEFISDLSTSKRVMIWVGTLALVTFIFWQYFYKDASEELANLQDKIETLNSQILNEKRLARNLDKIEKEVEELDLKLKAALQELPDKRQIPELLAKVSGLARDAGLEVSLFKPKSESFQEFYAEVPVSVSVAGNYHQVATFFDEVGRLDRIVNIRLLEMGGPKIKNDEIKVSTDCIATTFRYLDEEERMQYGGQGKKKRKRYRK